MFSLSSQKMKPPPPQFTITPDEPSSKNVGPNEKNNIIALHSYSLSLSHKDRAQTTHNTTRMSCPEMIVCAHCTIPFCVCKHKYIQHGYHGYGGKNNIICSNY